jgi:hypothetical protein
MDSSKVSPEVADYSPVGVVDSRLLVVREISSAMAMSSAAVPNPTLHLCAMKRQLHGWVKHKVYADTYGVANRDIDSIKCLLHRFHQSHQSSNPVLLSHWNA